MYCEFTKITFVCQLLEQFCEMISFFIGGIIIIFGKSHVQLPSLRAVKVVEGTPQSNLVHIGLF